MKIDNGTIQRRVNKSVVALYALQKIFKTFSQGFNHKLEICVMNQPNDYLYHKSPWHKMIFNTVACFACLMVFTLFMVPLLAPPSSAVIWTVIGLSAATWAAASLLMFLIVPVTRAIIGGISALWQNANQSTPNNLETSVIKDELQSPDQSNVSKQNQKTPSLKIKVMSTLAKVQRALATTVSPVKYDDGYHYEGKHRHIARIVGRGYHRVPTESLYRSDRQATSDDHTNSRADIPTFSGAHTSQLTN